MVYGVYDLRSGLKVDMWKNCYWQTNIHTNSSLLHIQHASLKIAWGWLRAHVQRPLLPPPPSTTHKHASPASPPIGRSGPMFTAARSATQPRRAPKADRRSHKASGGSEESGGKQKVGEEGKGKKRTYFFFLSTVLVHWIEGFIYFALRRVVKRRANFN